MNAGEVMSHNPIAVPAEAGLADALKRMFDHHVSGLPVIDGKARSGAHPACASTASSSS